MTGSAANARTIISMAGPSSSAVIVLTGRASMAFSEALGRSSSGMTANLVQLSAFVVVQELFERRLVHLVQHVPQFLVVAAALGEVGAIGSPERADQRIAVLA